MIQPDQYYFEGIKNDVTSLVKFCMESTSHRGVFSVIFDKACDIILWLQNSIDQLFHGISVL